MRKLVVPSLLLLTVLVLQGAKFGLRYAAPNILPPAGPITMAVAIYESEADDAMAYPKEHETMVSQTAQAMRKKNKWRQYDKDHVPPQYNVLATEAKAGQSGDKWRPWLGVYHDTTLTSNGPVPESDAGLKQLIEKNGGY